MLRDKNIFKDAEFGDRFLTRNQRLAIYEKYNNIRSCHVLLFDGIGEYSYNADGTLQGINDQLPGFDIVSKEPKYTPICFEIKKDKFFNEEFRAVLKTAIRVSILVLLFMLVWFTFLFGLVKFLVWADPLN